MPASRSTATITVLRLVQDIDVLLSLLPLTFSASVGLSDPPMGIGVVKTALRGGGPGPRGRDSPKVLRTFGD
jgi:hypothetical protein